MELLQFSVFVVFSILGTSNGQFSPGCNALVSYITPELENMSRNRKEMCRTFQGLLDCMMPKFEECIPTISDKNNAKMLTQHRDTMRTSFQSKCVDKVTAIPTSTAKTDRPSTVPVVVTDPAPATLVAPQIISLNSSVVLQKGDNFSVVCSGSKPLLWMWKPFRSKSETGLNNVSSESDNTDISGAPLFRQVLHIQSAEWFNTRAYTCRFEDWHNYPEEKMALTSSQIFIFVSDQDNPFQEWSGTLPVMYFNKPIDLECGVTDPRFKVTLRVNAFDITHQRGVKWDPQQGFRVLYTPYQFEGLVQCIVNANGSHLKREVDILDIHPELGYEPPRPIFDPAHYRVMKGETLVLRCWVRVPVNLFLLIAFDYPKRGDPRFEETRPLRVGGIMDEITHTLTIKDIQPDDHGTYKCNTTLNNRRFQVASAVVEVFEKPYLRLTPMVKNVGAYDTDKAVRLAVYVDCMPRYVIKWFFNGEELKETTHTNWSKHETFAKYAIKFPKTKDSGVYEAKAWNAWENGTLTNPQSVEITLIVHETDAYTLWLRTDVGTDYLDNSPVKRLSSRPPSGTPKFLTTPTTSQNTATTNTTMPTLLPVTTTTNEFGSRKDVQREYFLSQIQLNKVQMEVELRRRIQLDLEFLKKKIEMGLVGYENRKRLAEQILSELR